MKQLMDELKKNTLKKVYLLYGSEQYLVKLYEGRIKKKLMDGGLAAMNYTLYEGVETSISDAVNTLSTPPFMCSRRLVVIRGSGLFVSGRKNDSDACADILRTIPETSLLLFVESDVDKRLKLFKQVQKIGRAVEFVRPGEYELVDWVIRNCSREGKAISRADAGLLLRTVPSDMGAIECEIKKIVAYAHERSEITSRDIHIVCTKSLDLNIFEMVDAIGSKKPEKALDIFNNLLTQKESPIMVIAMITRQFRLILQSALWAKQGLSSSMAAERMGQRGFIVSACMKQARHFTIDTLKEALNDCLEADIGIKTGRINDKLAVEMLIVKYSQ